MSCSRKTWLNILTSPTSWWIYRKRYQVAAAVSTQESDPKRIDVLLKAEALTPLWMRPTAILTSRCRPWSSIRKRSKTIPVIGGNLITAEGFQFLEKLALTE